MGAVVLVDQRQRAKSASYLHHYSVWNKYKNSPVDSDSNSQASRFRGMYPMDWTYEEARTLISNRLDDKVIEKLQAKRNLEESRSIKTHNRDLFDNHLINGDRVCRNEGTRLKPEYNCIRPHTGPTRLGSPIYNQRTRILNSIRLFSPSRELDDDANEPKIKRHILQANERYKLEKSSIGVKFITENDGAETPSVELVTVRRNQNSLDLANLAKPSAQPQAKPTPHINTKSEQSEGKVQTISLPTVKLTQCNEAEIANEKQMQGKSHSASASHPQLHNVSSRYPSARSNGSMRSNTLQVKTQHWVDNLSDSSEISNQTPNPIRSRVASAKSKRSKPKSHQSQEMTNPNMSASEENKPSTTKLGVDNHKLILPSFICPSSEDKSRDFAVKLWLAFSDFERAPKTVPLL